MILFSFEIDLFYTLALKRFKILKYFALERLIKHYVEMFNSLIFQILCYKDKIISFSIMQLITVLFYDYNVHYNKSNGFSYWMSSKIQPIAILISTEIIQNIWYTVLSVIINVSKKIRIRRTFVLNKKKKKGYLR